MSKITCYNILIFISILMLQKKVAIEWPTTSYRCWGTPSDSPHTPTPPPPPALMAAQWVMSSAKRSRDASDRQHTTCVVFPELVRSMSATAACHRSVRYCFGSVAYSYPQTWTNHDSMHLWWIWMVVDNMTSRRREEVKRKAMQNKGYGRRRTIWTNKEMEEMNRKIK